MGVYDYYDYGYAEPAIDSAVAGVGGFMLVFVVLFYLLMIAFSIVSYVLNSLGTYTIAKRRGIHHPWLAWVPVGSMWLLGSISDQYQYVAKGRVRNRRKVLLGLTIGVFAALIAILVSLSAAIIGEVTGSVAGDTVFGAGLAITLLCYLAMLVLTIILSVYQYIALYDLFASCDPGNAVLYLVLTIFVGVVLPFFTFACRNKDMGMPPRRKAQPAQPIPAPVPEIVQNSEPEKTAEEPVMEQAQEPAPAENAEEPIAGASEEPAPGEIQEEN